MGGLNFVNLPVYTRRIPLLLRLYELRSIHLFRNAQWYIGSSKYFLYFILDKCYGVFILCFVLFLLLGIYNLMLSKTFIIQTSKMHLYVSLCIPKKGMKRG